MDKEQLYFAVGVGVGVAIARLWSTTADQSSPAVVANGGDGVPAVVNSEVWNLKKTIPHTLEAPPRVVEVAGKLAIDEHVGNASNGDGSISVAHVTVSTAMDEAVQVPGFDEYVPSTPPPSPHPHHLPRPPPPCTPSPLPFFLNFLTSHAAADVSLLAPSTLLANLLT